MKRAKREEKWANTIIVPQDVSREEVDKYLVSISCNLSDSWSSILLSSNTSLTGEMERLLPKPKLDHPSSYCIQSW